MRQNVAEKTSGGGVGGEMDEDDVGGGGGGAGGGVAPKKKTAASVYQASWLTRGWPRPDLRFEVLDKISGIETFALWPWYDPSAAQVREWALRALIIQSSDLVEPPWKLMFA